jgi:serine/threonine protein kinase
MSPEGYISNLYGPKTDVWAFGVLLFELVEGRTPCCNCKSECELKQCLLKQIDHSSFSSPISHELKDLIIRCLDVKAISRISALDIENTEWMRRAYRIVK